MQNDVPLSGDGGVEPRADAGNPPGPGSSGQPAPPPAATVVTNGPQTEETNDLRRKLDEIEHDKKAVEFRNMELEDENRRLRSIPIVPPPTPKKTIQPWTFFDDEQ